MMPANLEEVAGGCQVVSSLQRWVQNGIIPIGAVAVPTAVKPEETIFPLNPVRSDISTHKHSSTERCRKRSVFSCDQGHLAADSRGNRHSHKRRFMDECGQESGLMKPSRKGSGAVSAQQGQEAPGSLPCGPLGAVVTKAHRLAALTPGQSNQILLMTLRKLKVPLMSELKGKIPGFPGGAVVKNPPANAGDTGLSPGLGRSHVLRSNEAHAPQLLSLRSRARAPQQEKPPQ
ncbi:hypothetical protein J1605_019950 [Eschrichtius robustus]|uniref:Uncharacterized protein n=1 Tax=Eschrichtius robustus TaxID=9764 RepID=A0AB34HJ19_ESCRO|nr:hypothetical protein J1605_019950 [Eschrichtius robustus]